jgi:sortase B
MTVLLAVLLLLAFGCYALWDSEQVYAQADARQYEKYKPTVEDEGQSFEELRAVNPEVFSWLTVYGTNIDYPVVQGETNMKYVSTNAEGKRSMSGAIFLDCDNSGDFSDFNSILYGHHMERRTMFGEIGLFADKTYFDARPYGNLYFDGKDHGVEFFAFVHTDAYDNTVFRAKVMGGEAQQAYLANLFDLASHTRDIPVTTQDRLVLLSTCSASTTNGRDILVGKITDGVYEDPFRVEETDDVVKETPAADEVPGLWAQAPLWARIMIVALPLLLILLAIVLTYTKKKRAQSEHADTDSHIPDESED